MRKNFDEEKTMQVLSYIYKKNFDDFISLLKLTYFAERYSLRKFCIPIVADVFYAMKNGPVASNMYNMLKRDFTYKNPSLKDMILATGESSVDIEFDGEYDLLSKSDIESLDFAIDNFGKCDMVEISHLYPEWFNCKPRLDAGAKRVRMNIEDFFSEPTAENLCKIKEKLNKDDPYIIKNVEVSKSIYFEGV